MLEKIMLAINKYSMISAGDKILCAVSGGADSVAMVHLLAQLREKLGFTLCAAHFIHGLRPNDRERELELVKNLCAELEIELLWREGDTLGIAQTEKIGVEEAARKLRYEFLQSAAEEMGAQKIATAHHIGDNAETVLLNLARGTALRGLCGVPPVRGNIIRPLIYLSRPQIEQYLEENIINYATDPSNLSDIYARNKIRHAAMPILEEISPNAAQKILQMSESVREACEYLEGCAAEFLEENAEISAERVSVNAAALDHAPRPIATRAVMRIFGLLGVDGAAQNHIDAALALCANKKPSAMANLPCGFVARRNYAALEFCRPTKTSQPKTCPLVPKTQIFAGNYAITLDGCAEMGDTVYVLDDCADDADIYVRTRQTDDRIIWNGHHKSIKKLMMDEKIPACERDKIPLICADGAVLFVCGLSASSNQRQTGRKIIVRKICEKMGGAK